MPRAAEVYAHQWHIAANLIDKAHNPGAGLPHPARTPRGLRTQGTWHMLVCEH